MIMLVSRYRKFACCVCGCCVRGDDAPSYVCQCCCCLWILHHTQCKLAWPDWTQPTDQLIITDITSPGQCCLCCPPLHWCQHGHWQGRHDVFPGYSWKSSQQGEYYIENIFVIFTSDFKQSINICVLSRYCALLHAVEFVDLDKFTVNFQLTWFNWYLVNLL